MRRTVLPLVVLAAVLPVMASDAHAAAAAKSVLVLDLTPQGVSKDVAAQATQLLADALEGREALDVMTVEDIRSLLSAEEARSLLGCEANVSCLVDLTRGAKADLLVSGSIGKVGGTMTLSVTLVDAAAGSVSRRASVVVKELADLPENIRKLAEEMFGFAEPAAAFKLPSGQALSFAVLDLAATGVSKDVAANLTQILSTELKRVEGASVVSRQDIQAMLELEATKAQLGCDDMSCLAEIGGALGVQRLITGSVGRLADSHVISLRLIAVQGARVENRISESYAGGEEQLIRAVRHAGRRLLGIEPPEKGTLAISASEEGAQVFVDGKERGTLPQPPLAAIEAGRHSVKVAKGGFYDWTADVYIDPQDTTALWVPLKARPTPWYLRWWVWTAAGGCVTGAVLTTVVLVGAAVAGVFVATRPEPRGEVGVTVD